MSQCPGSTRAYSRMSVAGNDQAIAGLVTPVSHNDRDLPFSRECQAALVGCESCCRQKKKAAVAAGVKG